MTPTAEEDEIILLVSRIQADELASRTPCSSPAKQSACRLARLHIRLCRRGHSEARICTRYALGLNALIPPGAE